MNREYLIEAAAQALYGIEEEGPSIEAEERREGCRTIAEEVLDVVEPMIFADLLSRVRSLKTSDTQNNLIDFQWNLALESVMHLLGEDR